MPEPTLGNITTLLCDLDGTLLEVDMHDYVPAYLEGLGRTFSARVAPRRFVEVMHAVTATARRSGIDDTCLEDAYLKALETRLGLSRTEYQQGLNRYLLDGHGALRPMVRPIPLARRLLEKCRNTGLELVLATNPVFPRAVIRARLRWAGLADLPFVHLTSYENSRFLKPHPHYFTSLVSRLKRSPAQCLMIGNDAGQDIAAGAVGIPTYLVDTYLVDRGDNRFTADFRGDHSQLLSFASRFTPPSP